MPRICSVSSAEAWGPCTDAACSAAARTTSSSSPMIVSEQLVSLGQRRQSAMTRAMSCTSLLDARASLSQAGWQNPPMRGDELRELQAPLKERYRAEPDAASITLRAAGTLDEGVSCSVQTGRALATAGLHPLTGGDGSLLCSGDMLLEALVACAGVTLRAVATALEIPVEGGQVSAEGDLDFRGTLGVDRDAAVGFKAIRLRFALESPASREQLDTLLRLTERYCVVLQTLAGTPELSTSLAS